MDREKKQTNKKQKKPQTNNKNNSTPLPQEFNNWNHEWLNASSWLQ